MTKVEFKTDLKKTIKELEEGINDLGVSNYKMDKALADLKKMRTKLG